LTRLVGQAKAKELFFLPDMITATEAQQLNLVNRVFPHEKLWDEAMAIAERIASGPLMSYRYMKANINDSGTVDFRTMLNREAETHVRCGETEDHKEGVRAFMEKRQPVFRGR
jgi:2-(1,2-epoxy-1,2-dihydrophenyl)acetyl-CoA isomerase